MQSIFIILLPNSISHVSSEETADYLYKKLESMDLKLLVFLNSIDEWDFFFFNSSGIPEIEFGKLKADIKNIITEFYSNKDRERLTRVERKNDFKAKIFENLF